MCGTDGKAYPLTTHGTKYSGTHTILSDCSWSTLPPTITPTSYPVGGTASAPGPPTTNAREASSSASRSSSPRPLSNASVASSSTGGSSSSSASRDVHPSRGTPSGSSASSSSSRSAASASSRPSVIGILTIGSITATEHLSGFDIGSVTVSPGGPAVTLGSDNISLAKSGGDLAIDGSTTVIPSISASQSGGHSSQSQFRQLGNILSIDGFQATENPSGFTVGSFAVSPGGPAITAGQDMISLAKSGGALSIDDSTIIIPSASASHRHSGSPPSSSSSKLGSPSSSRSSSLLSDSGSSLASGLLSSSSSSAGPITTSTSSTVENGKTLAVPIIFGGSAPITLPPVTRTIVSQQATSRVSSMSTEIAGIVPLIHSWKSNPDSLKKHTLNKIKPVISDIKDLISDLGGDSSSSGCGRKKKRGLFGTIDGIVRGLSCMSQDLNSITGSIDGGVTDVEGALTDLTNQNDDLTNDDDNKSSSRSSSQSKSDSSRSSSSSKSSSSSSSSSSSCSTKTATDVTVLCQPTVTSAGGSQITTQTCSPFTTVYTTGCSVTGTTVTSSTSSKSLSQTPCASDTCGDACSMGGGPLSGAMVGDGASVENCASIPTITTDALPTASYGVLSGGSAVPTKRDLSNAKGVKTITKAEKNADELLDRRSASNALAKRALPDGIPPFANYVSRLEPKWIKQDGRVAGQWFDYPHKGYGAAGVKGIADVHRHGLETNERRYGQIFPALRDGDASTASITALVGTAAAPGPLNSIYSPTVWIMTPKTTSEDREKRGITTYLRYQDRANSLLTQVARIVPGNSKPSVVGYYPTNAKKSTDPGTAGRAILEVDREQYVITPHHAPNAPAVQFGRWRLWVEDKLIDRLDFRSPTTSPPTGTNDKRDVGHASLCGSSGSSSARSPADASGSTTGSSSALGSSSSLSSSGASRISSSSSASGSGSSSNSITSAPAPTLSCSSFEDPDANDPGGCRCSGVSNVLPFLTGSSNVCGYTAVPSGPAPSSSVSTFTKTISDGKVVACTSYTWFNYAVNKIPTCVESGKTISTVASIASAYSASAASTASLSSAASVSAAHATPYLPSSCTSTSPMETGNIYDSSSQTCAGSDGNAHSDIFTCGSNSTLFELFAPGGTPHSLGQASNDEGGWATFGGGGCFCINGNFCCNTDATTCLPINADFFESINDGPGANAVEWFQSSANDGQCTCNG
ncbi:MAG: hypothetical protein M1828_005676 [Chrysothrix sp. TS-e1954]|nr:MAG: hypothetical protein M1828_005676 [Chrysothrix sp. TS-e1954]